MEPESVTAEIGESVTFEVHWQSGHAAEACFVFAIQDGSGGWIDLGQHSERASELGEHKHFDQTVTIPELDPGTYTLRVSASEAYHRCPHPGEQTWPILAADVTVEAVCVENSRGAENADPPGHDKDRGDPGGQAHDSDEGGEMPGERKGHCKFD
ncbi:cupredoxin domain-containing protein [Natrinema amylolyticum]|uniref:cupredoxin domain-containing protein n=1 Tax=Natrinema amylolyticum TaxID=2878679 RepID=UPI001CFBA0DB|nr:cupredoxin domain-containing protein [Natrinema amylolyticum]